MILSFNQFNLLEYQARYKPILGTENNKTLRVREITDQLGYAHEQDMLKLMVEFEESIVSEPSDLDDYISQFTHWSKTNEDAGGVGVATAGASTGMGAVVTSTPSAVAGQTIGGNNVGDSFGTGGIVGSGDVGSGYYPASEISKVGKPKKRREKKKRVKTFSSLQAYKKSRLS